MSKTDLIEMDGMIKVIRLIGLHMYAIEFVEGIGAKALVPYWTISDDMFIKLGRSTKVLEE